MARTACSAEADTRLDRAELLCRQRGVQLTSLRRQVLGLILDSAKPAGAYDLLDGLRRGRQGATPPTVYRALDFLLEHGLIHKIESLSAFIGCIHAGERDDLGIHSVQFLVCRRCGRAEELEDADIGDALARAARHHGFALAHTTIEAQGTCAACAVEA
jgi:Fur family transcriptional regulator, zinc uptake regulator